MANILERKCWMSNNALQRGRGFRKVFFLLLLVLLHMAPCHSLPLKESCEVCAENGRYQIGESLTKNNKYKSKGKSSGHAHKLCWQ